LTEHLAIDLIEANYALDDIDLTTSCVAHLPFPSGRTQSLAYNHVVSRTIKQISADAFFTGNGGDNLFFLSQSSRAIVDRFRAEGLSRRLLETVKDVSALTGCSAIAALRQAVGIGACRSARYRWRPDRRFLSRQTLENAAAVPLDHPWLNAPDKALPGKAAHIAMLLRVQNHLDGSDRLSNPPVVHPLMSQPIMEACLQIPSWQCCAGGRDRSVARSAFKHRLPEQIIRRRTKGGPDGFAAQILKTLLPEIKGRLLDGQLASHKIIDRAAIEHALTPSALARDAAFVPLLLLLDAEAWVGHWQGRTPHRLLP
jgi:asparagine synthase (glutamine-hydrolysing)